MIFKSKFFWAATLLFLIVLGVLVGFIYPPLWQQFREARGQIASLDEKIATNQQFIEIIKMLENDEENLRMVYDQAQTVLPTQPNQELLLLQLEGLVNGLNLPTVSLAVTFGQGETTATKRNESAAKDQTTAQNTAADQTSVNFTINGEMSFEQLITLLGRLETLARWNKITSLQVSRANDKITINLSAQAGWKKKPNGVFTSTDKQFLLKAQAAFARYQPYVTAPNSKVEGTFGRADPLAPL